MQTREQTLESIKLHLLSGFRFVYVETAEENELIQHLRQSLDADKRFSPRVCYVVYDEATPEGTFQGPHVKALQQAGLLPQVAGFSFVASEANQVTRVMKKDPLTQDRFESFYHPLAFASAARLTSFVNGLRDIENGHGQALAGGPKVRFVVFIKDAWLQFFLKTRSYKKVDEEFARDNPRYFDLCFVMVSAFPGNCVPPDFSRYVVYFDYPLPPVERLLEMTNERFPNDGVPDERYHRVVESLAKAGVGLTEREYTLCLRLAGSTLSNTGAAALVERQHDVLALVHAQKMQVLRTSSQFLEYVPTGMETDPSKVFASVGGMSVLKEWVKKRRVLVNPADAPLNDRKRQLIDLLDKPKGILLFGVSGGGKSLMVKEIARIFRIPLLRLDVGRVFGQYVGESERNIRQTIQLAEATAPCVLWIDEIEKGFSQTGTGGGDSGTSSRVFGSFLTWMQEKTKLVFVVATANDIGSIPVEMTRMGRFDALFFVPLPDAQGRREIFTIHCGKYIPEAVLNRDQTTKLAAAVFPNGAGAAELRKITGAEIEQCVRDAVLDYLQDTPVPPPADVHTWRVWNAVPDDVRRSLGDDASMAKLLALALGRARPMYANRGVQQQYQALCQFASSRAIAAHPVEDEVATAHYA